MRLAILVEPQRAAILAFAKTAGYEIVEEFYEAAVSGADPVSERSGFADMLERKKPKGGKLSLRAISAALAAQGCLNERGRPFNPKSVAVMLAARAQ